MRTFIFLRKNNMKNNLAIWFIILSILIPLIILFTNSAPDIETDDPRPVESCIKPDCL